MRIKHLLWICSVIFLGTILVYEAHAVSYFVDATNGNDAHSGKSPENPWKTVSKINKSTFNAGDYIKLKAGGVWREQLIIPSSGSFGAPITVTRYGEGKNPLILQTEKFSNWNLIENNVYRGLISPNRRYFGMLSAAGTARVDFYINKPSYQSWTDQYFAGFYGNNDRYFYFKSKSGNPGDREVGVREFGIYINNKHFITIDGIDIYGPGGTNSSEIESSDCGAVFVTNSKSVTIKNCKIKYATNSGIRFTGSNTTNSVVENCDIEDAAIGIDILYAGPYHRISQTRITNIGTVFGDVGDRPFIGIGNTNHVTIEDCYMDTQGNGLGEHIDAGITFCCGAGFGIVRRNYIKNSARSGIIIGETNQNSDSYFYFHNNVIDGWGERFDDNTRLRCGIYLGGGNRNQYPFSGNIQVYNNLFVNGPIEKSNTNRDAAITVDNYEFGQISIINNIILSSNDVYDLFFNPKTYSSQEIKNNIIYSNSKTSINFGGLIYSSEEIECLNKSCFQNSNLSNYIDNNMNKDPHLIWDSGKASLSPNSPAIDSGIFVDLSKDFYRNPVPAGNSTDIGPFEFQIKNSNLILTPPKKFRLKN